jgi:hypothetical protein
LARAIGTSSAANGDHVLLNWTWALWRSVNGLSEMDSITYKRVTKERRKDSLIMYVSEKSRLYGFGHIEIMDMPKN